MTFSTTIPVRFGDVDSARIVYFPNILHYCHVTMEEFFAGHVGTRYADLMEQEHLGFPTVALETRFVKPIRYGVAVHATASVESIGNSSVVFVFRFFEGEGGPLLAESKNTTVAVDMRTFRPMRVPDALRARMLAS